MLPPSLQLLLRYTPRRVTASLNTEATRVIGRKEAIGACLPARLVQAVKDLKRQLKAYRGSAHVSGRGRERERERERRG